MKAPTTGQAKLRRAYLAGWRDAGIKCRCGNQLFRIRAVTTELLLHCEQCKGLYAIRCTLQMKAEEHTFQGPEAA